MVNWQDPGIQEVCAFILDEVSVIFLGIYMYDTSMLMVLSQYVMELAALSLEDILSRRFRQLRVA